MKNLKFVLCLNIVCFFATFSYSQLCSECKKLMTTMDVGKCIECNGFTSSSSHPICIKCSTQLHECEHCRIGFNQTQDSNSELIFNSDSNNKTVKLKIGQTFSIQLEGNPTTGYDWQIKKSAGNVVEITNDLNYQPNSNRVGGGGIYQISFQIINKGSQSINLEYLRPWEKVKADDTYNLHIEVLDWP